MNDYMLIMIIVMVRMTRTMMMKMAMRKMTMMMVTMMMVRKANVDQVAGQELRGALIGDWRQQCTPPLTHASSSPSSSSS